MDLMTRETPHRTLRPYTKTGVFRQPLTGPQATLIEQAGPGGIIRPVAGVSWLTLRALADKGAVDIIEQVIRHGPRGPIPGKITAVRVKEEAR